jgi:hypothetical protein
MPYDPNDYPGFQPLEGDAGGMDFSGAEPVGGAEANRRLAKMAMRKKRANVDPDAVIAKQVQDELLKRAIGTNTDMTVDGPQGREIPKGIIRYPEVSSMFAGRDLKGLGIGTPAGFDLREPVKWSPAQQAWFERMKAAAERQRMMEALAQDPSLAQ